MILLVLVVVGGGVPIDAQSNFGVQNPFDKQPDLEFGYQLHPQKFLENTEGIINIHALNNENILPVEINGLKVSSSDNTIVAITGISNAENYSTEIKILAKEPGFANISLAAPGFKSQEIPIVIYNNNNHPTQILLKTTPNDFPVDGPKFGYIGIELATTGNLPVIATEDTIVKISTPNTNVIKLQESEITIPKGEYYTLTKFNIKESGDAIIFAETEGMKKVSQFIHVREAKTPLQLQLYVFPKNFNSFSSQTGYAIVQLQDAEGIPVKADKNINLKIGVENPDSGINTSHDFEEFLFASNELEIKEGSYSTFSSFSIRPNVADFTDEFVQSYNFYIIADDHIAKGDSITVTHDEIGAIEGKGPAITQTLPFLTTGEKELVGVTYFETEVEVSRQLGTSTLGKTDRETVTVSVPVVASEDLFVNVASSNLKTVDAENAFIPKGKNTGLIFGNTGTMIPDEGESLEFYITDNKKSSTVAGEPNGPLEDDLSLIVEPLIPKILAYSQFPIIGYLLESPEEDEEVTTADDEEEEEDGRIGVTHFIKDSVMTFSANENFEIPPEVITQNQEYAVIFGQSNKIGTSSMTVQATGMETGLSLESHTTDPTNIELSVSKNILPMTKNLASIQLLDSVGNPAYAKNQITLEIVSNNQYSLKLPENIVIEKGEYFKSFEIESFSEGTTEITMLAEDLPMHNFELTVNGFHPEISLVAPNSIDQGTQITAELLLDYPTSTLSVENFDVNWNVIGGKIIEQETTTDSDGKARITIDEIKSESLEIYASVEGLGFTNLEINKTIKVIPAPITDAVTEETNNEIFTENNFILFAIPGAAGAAFFYLRKTNRLEEITERFNISEKIEEIKERVSSIRER
ncbi:MULTISPECIES: Ig-like domain-containing protein [Nitrosopumilus]|uniref:Ig-like domain-containing protein n=1 Tax=Nitrosopumilus TaxID=338191 RepID=UPI000B1B3B9E|nr:MULTISPECIES: Ig-like domain-containing protein [Nitrosopumilus]